MKTSLWLQPQLNAIVFENRNREYGAFELRTAYHQTMSRSIVISILFFVMAFLGIRYYQEMISKQSIKDPIADLGTVVILDPIYQLERPKPKPIVHASVPAIQSHQAVTPPRVLIDELVTETVNPPAEANFQENVIGTGDEVTGENPIEEVVSGGGDTGNAVEEVANTPVPIYMVDQQPEFPGGTEAMYKYLKKHLSFPEIAKDNNLTGTVVMQFMVSATGEIEQVTVVKSPSSLFNGTSLEAIKGMPKWKPGIFHGKPVPVMFTLPLKFELL